MHEDVVVVLAVGVEHEVVAGAAGLVGAPGDRAGLRRDQRACPRRPRGPGPGACGRVRAAPKRASAAAEVVRALRPGRRVAAPPPGPERAVRPATVVPAPPCARAGCAR